LLLFLFYSAWELGLARLLLLAAWPLVADPSDYCRLLLLTARGRPIPTAGRRIPVF
jgi:hypothetical protein